MKIHELGGKFVQNFAEVLCCVVGVNGENLGTLEEKCRSKNCPIFEAGWIRRCRAEKSKEKL